MSSQGTAGKRIAPLAQVQKGGDSVAGCVQKWRKLHSPEFFQGEDSMWLKEDSEELIVTRR